MKLNEKQRAKRLAENKKIRNRAQAEEAKSFPPEESIGDSIMRDKIIARLELETEDVNLWMSPDEQRSRYSPASATILGKMYLRGWFGIEKDIEKAEHWLTIAMNKNDGGEAARLLAEKSHSYNRSKELISLSTKQGDPYGGMTKTNDLFDMNEFNSLLNQAENFHNIWPVIAEEIERFLAKADLLVQGDTVNSISLINEIESVEYALRTSSKGALKREVDIVEQYSEKCKDKVKQISEDIAHKSSYAGYKLVQFEKNEIKKIELLKDVSFLHGDIMPSICAADELLVKYQACRTSEQGSKKYIQHLTYLTDLCETTQYEEYFSNTPVYIDTERYYLELAKEYYSGLYIKQDHEKARQLFFSLLENKSRLQDKGYENIRNSIRTEDQTRFPFKSYGFDVLSRARLFFTSMSEERKKTLNIAKCWLAYMYMNGKGGEQDISKARDLLLSVDERVLTDCDTSFIQEIINGAEESWEKCVGKYFNLSEVWGKKIDLFPEEFSPKDLDILFSMNTSYASTEEYTPSSSLPEQVEADFKERFDFDEQVADKIDLYVIQALFFSMVKSFESIKTEQVKAILKYEDLLAHDRHGAEFLFYLSAKFLMSINSTERKYNDILNILSRVEKDSLSKETLNFNGGRFPQDFNRNLSREVQNLIVDTEREMHAVDIEKTKSQQLEDLMGLFHHKFRGPLSSIIFNAEHHNYDENVYLDAARTMNGMLDVFGFISTSSDRLLPELEKDLSGAGNFETLLNESLGLAVIQLLSRNAVSNISRYLHNCAIKNSLVDDVVSLASWRDDFEDEQEKLRQMWEEEIAEIMKESPNAIIDWVNGHLFPVTFIGIYVEDISFKKYGIKESILKILFTELFVNMIKYTDISSEQKMACQIQITEEYLSLNFSNPSSISSRRPGQGSGRGLKFIQLICNNIQADLAVNVRQNLSSVIIDLPKSLFMRSYIL
ncbi:MAG: hypothetical protein ACKE9I_04385 [Methylophagaceae bacterium]